MGSFSRFGGSADYEVLDSGISDSFGEVLNSTSWTEMIASTAINAVGIILNYHGKSASYVNSFDLGIGASSNEKVLLDQLLFEDASAENLQTATNILIPVMIPAGTRISGRIASSSSVCVYLTLVTGNFGTISPFSEIESIGVTSGNGVSVTPDTAADTWGSWIEIISSTSNPIKYLYTAACRDAASHVNLAYQTQVAVGASSSEKIILGSILNSTESTTDTTTPQMVGPFPVDIPAGTRLSMRTKSNGASAPALEMALYGAR